MHDTMLNILNCSSSSKFNTFGSPRYCINYQMDRKHFVADWKQTYLQIYFILVPGFQQTWLKAVYDFGLTFVFMNCLYFELVKRSSFFIPVCPFNLNLTWIFRGVTLNYAFNDTTYIQYDPCNNYKNIQVKMAICIFLGLQHLLQFSLWSAIK